MIFFIHAHEFNFFLLSLFSFLFLGPNPRVVALAGEHDAMKRKFTILDPAGGMKPSSDGYIITRIGVSNWQQALLTPQISAHSPPAYLKLKINTTSYPDGLFLGVIGESSPPSGASFVESTFYGFHNANAYAGGYVKFPIKSYGAFETGDTVVFQLDTTAHTLKMVITRLGLVSTITGLKDIPAYWFCVNLYYTNDRLEVLDVTPSDIKLF